MKLNELGFTDEELAWIKLVAKEFYCTEMRLVPMWKDSWIKLLDGIYPYVIINHKGGDKMTSEEKSLLAAMQAARGRSLSDLKSTEEAELIISKIENWLTKNLLYNTLIRFFIESYIEILVSSMV